MAVNRAGLLFMSLPRLMKFPPVCKSWETSEILIAENQAMIFFELQPGADQYKIRFREVGTTDWTRKSTSYTSFYTGQINPDSEYEYQSSTKCEDGWSPWSASVYFLTPPEGGLLAAPQLDGTPLEGRTTSYLQAPELFLYPNPASDVLNVVLMFADAQQFLLLDASGRTLDVVVPVEGATELQLSSLSPGMYFLQARLENGELLTQRFVKQ